MKNFTKDYSITYLVSMITIMLSVIIGTIIRFKGLGTWPLALDEYYIIKSVNYILEHGLPQFPNGGFYVRGILIQYLIAPLLTIGIKAEFAGRLFSVLANLVTIPAIYLITKRIGNQLLATIIVVIFSFSVWEIEFARFARMYAPFQAIFMWYIYFALVDYENKNFKNYKWLLVLSAISFLVYEGSIFLAVFNFVPFILYRKIKLRYLLGAVITFFASAFFNLFDFRTLFSKPILPQEFSNTIIEGLAKFPIKMPKILLTYTTSDWIFILLFIVVISLNIFLFSKLLKTFKRKDFWSIIAITSLVLFALFNQFGIFLLALILYISWKIIEIVSVRQFYIYISLLFIVNLIFWFGFGIFSSSWYSLFTDFSSYSMWGVSKRLFVGFFNYPDNYLTLLNYFRTLPILTLFSAISLFYLIFRIISNKNQKSTDSFLIGSLIFVSLLATIPTLLYQETRYTFFAAPLLLILVNLSLFKFITSLIAKNKTVSYSLFVVCALMVFILSKDFNFYHITNIDKSDVNYRMIYKNNYLKKHLYRRWDIKTPATYVNENMDSDDIVMINENSHEYYLNKVDYFNFNYRHRAFVALSVNEGEKERWSNSKLIYTNEQLINLIENRQNTIWFTVYPENWLFEIDFYTRYKANLVYEGIDGMIKVFKFPTLNNNIN